jgi:hypothetical protein
MTADFRSEHSFHNYCQAMDRRADERGSAVCHEDSTAGYGPDVSQGSRRDFVDRVPRFPGRYPAQVQPIGTGAARDAYLGDAEVVHETPQAHG